MGLARWWCYCSAWSWSLAECLSVLYNLRFYFLFKIIFKSFLELEKLTVDF